jgi:hypothetical protein
MTSSSARQICTSVGSARMRISLHKRSRSLAPFGLRETALSQKGSCLRYASLMSAMLSTGHRPLFAAYRPSVSLEGSMKDCREAWVILILGYVRSSSPSKQARTTYVRNGTHPLDRSAHDVAHSDPVTGNASWILRGPSRRYLSRNAPTPDARLQVLLEGARGLGADKEVTNAVGLNCAGNIHLTRPHHDSHHPTQYCHDPNQRARNNGPGNHDQPSSRLGFARFDPPGTPTWPRGSRQFRGPALGPWAGGDGTPSCDCQPEPHKSVDANKVG